MKNLKKILGACLIIALVIIAVSTNVMAAFSYNNIDPDTNNSGDIANVGNNILSIIRVIGMILSVGVIMVLGIKYMMGSAEEKAEYKKTMIPYFVGAILIFAATFIVSAIFTFANNI